MAWTTPMTAVAHDTFTAAEFNLHLRDNLEYLKTTQDSVVSTQSGLVTDVGTLQTQVAALTPVVHTVLTSQSTSSTTYTNLSTVGPTVTVATGTVAMVHYAARVSNNQNGSPILFSVAVSGATSISASDDWAVLVEHDSSSSDSSSVGRTHLFTGLTPGNNTFTMRYRGEGTAGWSATYRDREIIVQPY